MATPPSGQFSSKEWPNVNQNKASDQYIESLKLYNYAKPFKIKFVFRVLETVPDCVEVMLEVPAGEL